MANFAGESMKFLVTDTGAVERDLSAYITSVDGLPGDRELRDVTTLGATGRRRFPGLQDATITVEGFFDDTATSGPDAVLGPLRTDNTARTFKFGPKGSTAGFVRYTGTCLVSNYTVLGQVGGMVLWRLTLGVDGAVTRDTF